MKYYIGYKEDEKFVPIISDEIPTTILALAQYTAEFDDEYRLKDKLFEDGLIKDKSIKLAYLIRKKQDNEYIYEEVPSNGIFTMESEDFVYPDDLRGIINKQKGNIDFIITIYAENIKKNGYFKTIKNHFDFVGRDVDRMYNLLKELERKVPFTTETSKQLSYPIKYYETDRKLENFSEKKFRFLVNEFLEKMEEPKDILNLFFSMSSRVTYPMKVPVMSSLYEWYTKTYHKNNNSYDFHEHDEYIDVQRDIDNFISQTFYSYDSKKHEYRKENGEYKLAERKIFDLAVMIEKYYIIEYNNAIEEYRNQMPEPQPTDDPDYEFIEEEDFERIGTTSEEAGIVLRMKKQY